MVFIFLSLVLSPVLTIASSLWANDWHQATAASWS